MYGSGGGAYLTDLITQNNELHTYVNGTLHAGDKAEASITRRVSVQLAPRSMLAVGGTYDFNTSFGGPDPYFPLLTGYLMLTASRFELGDHVYGRVKIDHSADVRDNFSFNVVNNGDSVMSFWLELETGVTMSHPITALAVPEPETHAMLLSGLGLLGLAAARRRVHS